MFKIGDQVSVELTGYKGGLYTGTIVDNDLCNDGKGNLVPSGRFGVDLENSPFQYNPAYFWPHEIKLEENV